MNRKSSAVQDAASGDREVSLRKDRGGISGLATVDIPDKQRHVEANEIDALLAEYVSDEVADTQRMSEIPQKQVFGSWSFEQAASRNGRIRRRSGVSWFATKLQKDRS